MNKPAVLVMFLLTSLVAVQPRAHGEPPPPAAQADGPAAGGARVREFQGDDVGQVLRLLARQAKIDLVVAEAVKGNISLRLENKTAMDAIEIIVHANKLAMTKDDKGVYYVEPAAAKVSAESEAENNDDDMDKAVPAATGEDAANAALDFLAKPETAQRIARYKRNLYNALLREGFNVEQAVQIVAADRAGEVFTSAGGER